MAEGAFGIAEAASHIGEELGLSGWFTIGQDRIDAFAETTEDRYWIHTDPARGRAGPFGATIAHGFLTLSLLTPLIRDAGLDWGDDYLGINYGFEKVRFIAPVKAGCRVRARVVLAGAEEREPGHHILRLAVTVEIEGEEKPALVAEWLNMFIRDAA
jgi:acyl dehydratase